MQAGCYVADTHCVPSDLSSPALPAELANATGSLAVLLLPTKSGNKQDPQNKDVLYIQFICTFSHLLPVICYRECSASGQCVVKTEHSYLSTIVEHSYDKHCHQQN